MVNSVIVKGTKINDRYQIIKTLGEGGMANVYLAHDTYLDRNVAVKVLRGDLANDEKFVRRFQREALSATSLSHPNIVEIYDVGEDDGQYYIVMEYVDGKTLKQVLKQRGHLSVTEVVDIMLQVTDGMAHAHDAYIIHRDIKPQNIMMLSNGMIKITDFGVAIALNSTQLTQTNSVMGTVHYIPPEQANGKGSTIRSDIYSMGIMMYELLTGLLPYKGDNAVEIALKHLREPLPSVRKFDSSIPQSIENVIIKATAKNPKNRYKDAREMHDDLKTALDASRVDEKRYVYPYPENDLEETKALDKEVEAIKDATKTKKVEKIKDDIDEEKIEDKKQNKALIIILSIFVGLVLLLTVGLTILLHDDNKEAVIPDVANKTIQVATKMLNDAGFDIAKDYKYIASDVVKEGDVVKTSPEIGSNNKLPKEVILYISSGESSYVMENFIGENYLIAQGKIEALCQCNVEIVQEAVDESKNPKEDTVLKTEPAEGEKSKLGSPIKIYIPKVEYKYPDFTKGYTVAKIEEFASKHELKLEIKYQETTSVTEGTILKQSRAASSLVTPGASLVITVARAPEVEEPTTEPTTEPTEGDNTGE